MRSRTLLWRGLVFYRRSHLGVVLGAALATAVLTGGLLVGDSVRYTLRHMAEARLGRVDYTLSAGDRFMRAALADDLATAAKATVAPVLKLDGVGSTDGGQRRTGKVQVLGVDARFWALSGVSDRTKNLPLDGVVINPALAEALDLSVGDDWLLRLESQDWIPGELPFAARESRTRTLRLKVSAIVERDSLGLFGLEPHQRDPLNCYLPLERLAMEVEREAMANLLLVEDDASQPELDQALKSVFKLADAELTLRAVQGDWELGSQRVFIDPPVEAAAQGLHPERLLTYFVNGVKKGNRATPYSFVAGLESSRLGRDLGLDGIVLSDWMARDLSARTGDKVTLAFWLPEAGQKLTEQEASFTVRGVYPLDGSRAQRDLTPAFPGLTDVDNCRDWDPAIPIALDAIRDQDEAYWTTYGPTAKARISVDAARALWSSRFGALTALRFGQREWDRDKLESAILASLDPLSLGFVFRPVRQEALAASGQAMDFGQLFLGLSFFLMLAALILAALLFVLGVEQRTAETGTLRALGFTRRAVGRLLLSEGLLLSAMGALVGVAVGVLYNRLTLHALATFWIGAVGTRYLIAHTTPMSLAIGGVSGWLTALAAMAFTLRRQSRLTLKDLQQQSAETGGKVRSWVLWVGLVMVLAAVAIALVVHPAQDKNAANAFWGAGGLMLLGSLMLVHHRYGRMGVDRGLWQIDIAKLGRRATARRRGRSTAAVALLALGVFITVAVGANRRSTLKNAEDRHSGTGGFALYAETTLPLRESLTSTQGRAALGLQSGQDDDVSLVGLKLRPGADASCLNLNHIALPKILGVDAQAFIDRDAFSFATKAPGVTEDNVWSLLTERHDGDVIPAVADQGVIVWGLAKAVGDTLDYTDESGKPLKLRLVGGLVNSVFQGAVLIGQDDFVRAFPSVSGASVLLVDAPPLKTPALRQTLLRTLGNLGVEIETTADRLARFLVIENTYLSIFLSLGGLALMVGTLGLGVLLFRNVMERRSELALLRAVGYDGGELRRLLAAENLSIFISGTAIGAVSALVAVTPALLAPGARIPYVTLLGTLAAILLSGLIWIGLAARLALRQRLVTALRNE